MTATTADHRSRRAGLRSLVHVLAERLRAEPAAWLALLLILPAILPLAAPGYFFHAHDAQHSVFFLVEFHAAVSSGVIWPFWAPDQAIGFGYPLWLVYAPLAYVIAEIFHLLGMGFVVAVKATWALSFVLGGLGMYRLARRWWGPAPALIASLAYTYAPYHLVQMYVRAALAECAGLGWFPWVVLAFDELWDDPRPRRLALAALALGALLLTHTVSQLLFVPFLAAYLLLKLLAGARVRAGATVTRASLLTRFRPAAWSISAAVAGAMVAMIFVLPALFELRYVVQSQFMIGNYNYTRQFVYPSQFFSPLWGFGYAVEGPNDDMSMQLGLLPFVGAVAGAFVALRPGRIRLPHRTEALFMAGASLVIILAMTPVAEPLWRTLPLVDLIQFPWRLLALTAVSMALLAGAAVYWLERETLPDRQPGPYVYLAALLIVLAGFPYTRPELVPVRPQDESPLAVIDFETHYPDMRGMTRWSERRPADDDSPLLAEYLAGETLRRAAIIGGEGAILAQNANGAGMYARVQAAGETNLRFYTYYFPGWQATIDGQPVPMRADPPNGLIGITVPPGEHEVRVRFGATPLRRVAAGITLVTLAALAGILAIDRGHRRR